MKCADEILAGLGVDTGLSADRGIDHGQQRGGHVHHLDPAQPRGGGESRRVGGRPSPEANHGVLASDSDAAQHFPDETEDGQVLARLRIGDLDAMRIDAAVGQRLANFLGGDRQGRLVQDRHLG